MSEICLRFFGLSVLGASILDQKLGHVKESVLGSLEHSDATRGLADAQRRPLFAGILGGGCGRLVGLLLFAQLLLDELLHLGVFVALIGLFGKVAIHAFDYFVAALLLDALHVHEAARAYLPRIVL